MSLKDWLLRKLAGDDSAELELSPEEEELSGLNLKEVLNAHILWKEKLNTTLDGTSTERYEVTTVSQDNLCVLGKWIYGPGKQKYSKLPEYEALRKVHQDFHTCAADVLQKHEDGQQKAAEQILNGVFREASNQIQLDLVRLFTVAR
ncbi:MAG: CZB domain-containing protein [Gammaproteobacteria bacterium]|nr:CZB domain-containing protein [Gammaproteobacteria bacterium]